MGIGGLSSPELGTSKRLVGFQFPSSVGFCGQTLGQAQGLVRFCA